MRRPKEEGLYFWRVAALDKEGIPGVFSTVSRFLVIHDQTPPFLTVKSPPDGSVVQEATVLLSGDTEAGAVLSIDKRTVSVDHKGHFSHSYPLKKGKNSVTVKAVDAAGNIARTVHTLRHTPPQAMFVEADPELLTQAPWHFLTQKGAFSLSGRTLPGSRVTVADKEGNKIAVTAGDTLGRFHLSLPVQAPRQEYMLTAVASFERVREMPFIVEIDAQAPFIDLADGLPRITSRKNFEINGEVKDATRLWINGKPLAFNEQGRFNTIVNLRAGENIIEASASDASDNTNIVHHAVLDRKAPRLIKYTLEPSGMMVRVLVEADDNSGLKQAASFRLSAGTFEYTGFLRLLAGGHYEGAVYLPPENRAKPKLKMVVLDDYAGNSREYREPEIYAALGDTARNGGMMHKRFFIINKLSVYAPTMPRLGTNWEKFISVKNIFP